MFSTTVGEGTLYHHRMAGGGGWGDPLERDPEAVLSDVRNEYLSAERAKTDYGVIVDTKAWRVDGVATSRLRGEIRAARGWRKVPKVQWHDPIVPDRGV